MAADLCFEHDGIALAYDDLGDRGAPAVVLLHGGSMSRGTWSAVAPRLAATHRVLAVDLAGHGDSDRAPGGYAVPDQGRRIAALCENVVGGDVVVIGSSYGALVAVYLAAERPDIVLAAVLGDPPIYIMDPDVWPSTMFGMFFPMLRAAMEDAHRTDDPAGSMAAWLRTLPVFAEMLGEEGIESSSRSWAKCDPEVLAATDGPSIGAVWGGHSPDAPIDCPVLVLRADPSVLAAFAAEHEDRFRQAAAGSQFVFAEGCGHGIHEERPDWFTEQVETFLAALGATHGTTR